MLRTVKSVLSAAIVCVLLALPRAAYATGYVGAWYVDSAAAVDALEANNFNLFVVTVPDQGDVNFVQFGQLLDAIDPGHVAIINLDGADANLAYRVITYVAGSPNNAKVAGYLTYGEGNLTNSQADQQNAYNYVKSLDSSKSVFVGYHANCDGVANMSNVVTTANVAWNYVMVNYYPYRIDVSNATAISKLNAAISSAPNNILSVFGSAPIIPVQQAAGLDVGEGTGNPACGSENELRAVYDLSTQYSTWYNAGLMNATGAFVFYSWKAGSMVDLGGSGQGGDSSMLYQASIMAAYHRNIYGW